MGTTKRELCHRIAGRLQVNQTVSIEVVQAFLDEMLVELESGNRLEFRDFGIFDLKDKDPRIARNPSTGEPIPITAKRVVRFKAGRAMKERVQKAFERKTCGGT